MNIYIYMLHTYAWDGMQWLRRWVDDDDDNASTDKRSQKGMATKGAKHSYGHGTYGCICKRGRCSGGVGGGRVVLYSNSRVECCCVTIVVGSMAENG